MNLLDIALEVLALDQIRDIILIFILLALSAGLVLLHVLVALGELAEGGEAVGAKLVKDTRDELGKFLLFAVTVESEGVGGNGGVDFIESKTSKQFVFLFVRLRRFQPAGAGWIYKRGGWLYIPLGAPKWMTFPSSLNMLTSSMAWMGWTFIFFRVAWSFLSSAPEDLWTFLTLRRGVPLPLFFLG